MTAGYEAFFPNASVESATTRCRSCTALSATAASCGGAGADSKDIIEGCKRGVGRDARPTESWRIPTRELSRCSSHAHDNPSVCLPICVPGFSVSVSVSVSVVELSCKMLSGIRVSFFSACRHRKHHLPCTDQQRAESLASMCAGQLFTSLHTLPRSCPVPCPLPPLLAHELEPPQASAPH